MHFDIIFQRDLSLVVYLNVNIFELYVHILDVNFVIGFGYETMFLDNIMILKLKYKNKSE